MFFRRRPRSFKMPLLCGLFLTWPLVAAPTPAIADETRVIFDAPLSIACHEITTDEFAAAHPNEKLIETTIRVSVLVTAGPASEIDYLLLNITSPERRLRIVDYLPKTELGSELAGPVSVVDVSNHEKSLKASLGGGVGFRYGLADVSASPTGSAGTSKHESSKRSFERLPPQYLLLASGTSNGGYGVFFKIRSSSQTSLEGGQEFVCRFAVPRAWRGDWVRLTCRAYGSDKDIFSTKTRIRGQSNSLIGLYAAGDIVAQETAEQLARSQTVATSPSTIAKPATNPWKSSIYILKRAVDSAEKRFGLASIFQRGSDSVNLAQQRHANRVDGASEALARFSGNTSAAAPLDAG